MTTGGAPNLNKMAEFILKGIVYLVCYPFAFLIILNVCAGASGFLFGNLMEEEAPPTVEKAQQDGLPPERSSDTFRIDDDFGF